MGNTPATLDQPPSTKPAEIAPRWHTILLVVVLLLFSLSSAFRQRQLSGERSPIPLYVATMAWQYALLAYVYFGVRRRGGGLRDLIGGRWKDFEDFLIDVGLGLLYWVISALILVALLQLMGFGDPAKYQEARKALLPLFPRGALESAVWVGVAVTAGFCEEIVFRGYLQRQIAAISGNVTLAVVAQAVLFGAGHGYQGPERMLVIAVWGAMFGMLVLWRKSLRPGMIAHAFHNTLVGLVGRFVANAPR
jgi:membrane protease YdiL (CAAX protease family)